jgi:hypothetical protein
VTAQILSFQEDRMLRRLHKDPGTSVRRIAAAEIIGFTLVWRFLTTINQGCCFASGFSQNAL